MVLEWILLFTVATAFDTDCGEFCYQNETCCPGPHPTEPNCCPFENAVCCDDGTHCCPEGSFCDQKIRMCGMHVHPRELLQRFGDIEEETADSGSNQFVKRAATENPFQNEISHIDLQLVHCDLNQYCPFPCTCCKKKEEDAYMCCPHEDGVCCSDQHHCCRRGEECDSQGIFCLQDMGLETIVREADFMRHHKTHEGLELIQNLNIKELKHEQG